MKSLASIVFFMSLVDSATAWALPAPTFRTVALTGQQAPAANGAVFSSASTPSINNDGQVTFVGRLALQGSVNFTNDSGLWSEGTGSLALVAREGDSAVGVPTGNTYADFDNATIPTISDSGDAVWDAGYTSIQVPPSTMDGIWSGKTGTVSAIATQGTQAPGLPAGATFLGMSHRGINSHGEVAFVGSVVTGQGGVTSANNVGIWSTLGGGTAIVVRTGDPAPSTPAGVNFRSFFNVKSNAAGDIAFSADIDVIEAGTQFQSGIWSTEGGTLHPIVRDFDPAAGGPAGSDFNFASFNPFSLNSSGQVTFSSNLRTSTTQGINADNDAGIWSTGSGSLSLVAREGEQAPDLSAGNVFQEFINPVLSDDGYTAFVGSTRNTMTGQFSSGIWSDAAGMLNLVAGSGMPAPGVPNGLFSALAARASVRITINAARHLAFIADIVGNGIDTTDDSGLWAQDPNGTLQLLVREGELFEVAPGDQRIVSGFSLRTDAGEGGGLTRSFTTDHQLVLHLSFTDGTSGIFVAQLAVPEPGAMILLACGLFLGQLRK